MRLGATNFIKHSHLTMYSPLLKLGVKCKASLWVETGNHKHLSEHNKLDC